MTAFKEFQGKTLDEAIEEACQYYDVPREKLEIDIVNDAKSGIFGLVGVKKATIKAARAQLNTGLLSESKDKAPKAAPKAELRDSHDKKPAKQIVEKVVQAPAKAGCKDAPCEVDSAPCCEAKSGLSKASTGNERQKPKGQDKGSNVRPEANTNHRNAPKPAARPNRPAPKQDRALPKEDRAFAPAALNTGKVEGGAVLEANLPDFDGDFDPADALQEGFADGKIEFALDLHSEEIVCTEVCQVISRLILPIVGEVPCTASAVLGRVRVEVDCGEAAGILVGREGQTLAAIQYLTARIAGKKLGGAVRLQIDVGNYRERQEERLRELALFLAEKVKTTKRSQSTRPLTAYQRRIIHLALEGEELLHTHSKGEGNQKRVIIQLRRASKNSSRAEVEQNNDATLDAEENNAAFDEETSKA